MSEKIQPLNYCTHAITDLKTHVMMLNSNRIFKSANALESIIDLLQKSIKFILPNCAEIIIGDTDDICQSHIDLLRLPYPCTAFEIPWETANDVTQYEGLALQQKSNKRIALCWDANTNIEPLPGLNEILQVFSEGGIFVVPIYWGNADNSWQVACGGIFVPYNNQLRKSGKTLLPSSQIAATALRNAGKIKPLGKGSQIMAEPFCILPEIFEIMAKTLGGYEKAVAQIQLDAVDEVKAVIQACCALNCANIKTSDLAAPKFLNTRREKKGKTPFYSYKVLQLKETSKLVTNKAGGTHSSPKMHLRRGHLRRLVDKTIWVKASIINANSERGVVDKDYAVYAKSNLKLATEVAKLK